MFYKVEINMEVNPLASALNQDIIDSNETIFELLSKYGKRLYFPKGIISQSQEAKEIP